jgi:hypothetical protein
MPGTVDSTGIVQEGLPSSSFLSLESYNNYNKSDFSYCIIVILFLPVLAFVF